jgi:hypothetical protein
MFYDEKSKRIKFYLQIGHTLSAIPRFVYSWIITIFTLASQTLWKIFFDHLPMALTVFHKTFITQFDFLPLTLASFILGDDLTSQPGNLFSEIVSFVIVLFVCQSYHKHTTTHTSCEKS